LLSLSLIGLPLSGGSGAKSALDLATGGELGLLLTLSGFATALMIIHFLWTVKKLAVKRSYQPVQTPHLLSPSLAAWWLLLPLAWFGPFLPGSILFEGKSLLVAGFALALFLYIHQTWRNTSRQAVIFQPGDIYHLFKRMRLLNPVLIKHGNGFLTPFRWPQPLATKESSDLSLTVPGLLWIVVFTLLIISFLIPS